MKQLSFTQEYFLCAVNSKGDVPVMTSSEIAACLVAGGIMELTEQGLIARDEKKKIAVIAPWDNARPYLKPLYDTIAANKKSKGVDRIVEPYTFSFSDKHLKALIEALRESLLAADCLDVKEDQGLLKNKTQYVPKPKIVTAVIEKIRAEFLEEGSMAADVVCLAVLLDATNLIRSYFSKVESAAMKKRIKEVRKSDAYAAVKDVFEYLEAVLAVVVAINAAT